MRRKSPALGRLMVRVGTVLKILRAAVMHSLRVEVPFVMSLLVKARRAVLFVL